VLDVDMAGDGWFLGAESLLFGRAAMGESVGAARLHDTIRIRRDGKLLLHDAIRMEGAVAECLARPAVGRGARAVATLVHVAADAETRLDTLRAAWVEAPAEAGASAWNGMLVGRLVAADAAALRQSLIMGLQALRAGRKLPPVWMC
jgi:urease accessory protein